MLPGFLKCFYYRLKGQTIGKHVHFSIGSLLIAKEIRVEEGCSFGFFAIMVAERIHIGKRVRIASFTFLSARELAIGDDSAVHEFAFSGIQEGPHSVLRIGKRVEVGALTVINPTMGVIIEDDVGIGARSLILTHGVWQSALQGYPVKYAPVTIQKGAWLPWDIFVMPGVTIGQGATIGARALVTSDIPPRSLAIGIPAHVTKNEREYPRSLSFDEKQAILADIFQKYAEYAVYKGCLAKFEGTGDSFLVVMGPRENPKGAISYAKPAEEIVNQRNITSVLVSLTSIDAEQGRKLEERGIAWIDLMHEKRSSHTNALADDFVKFLDRYGIKPIRV